MNFPCSECVDGEEVRRAGGKQPRGGEAPTRVVWEDTGDPCLRIPGLLRWGERTGEQVRLPPGGCGQRCPGGLALWLSGVRSAPPNPQRNPLGKPLERTAIRTWVRMGLCRALPEEAVGRERRGREALIPAGPGVIRNRGGGRREGELPRYC